MHGCHMALPIRVSEERRGHSGVALQMSPSLRLHVGLSRAGWHVLPSTIAGGLCAWSPGVHWAALAGSQSAALTRSKGPSRHRVACTCLPPAVNIEVPPQPSGLCGLVAPCACCPLFCILKRRGYRYENPGLWPVEAWVQETDSNHVFAFSVSLHGLLCCHEPCLLVQTVPPLP